MSPVSHIAGQGAFTYHKLIIGLTTNGNFSIALSLIKAELSEIEVGWCTQLNFAYSLQYVQVQFEIFLVMHCQRYFL